MRRREVSTTDQLFPSSGKFGREDARPRKASRVVPSYSETPFRRQQEVIEPQPSSLLLKLNTG